MGKFSHCISRHAYIDTIQPPQNAALRAVMDLGIFPLLMDKKYRGIGVSATQLAEYSGAERELVGLFSRSIRNS